MKSVKSILLALVSVLAAHSTMAQTFNESSQDLRVQQLRAAPEAPLANTLKETVSFSSVIDRTYTDQIPAGFVAISREYRVGVSADQLQQGIDIKTTGPGAVVALSPIGSVKGQALSPLDISIRTADGAELRGSDGMDQLVDQRAIQATGVPFSNGMIGFRLNRALGSGTFTIRANKSSRTAQYQLHVLDAQGSAQLTLQAPHHALVGQSFEATGRFEGAITRSIKNASAFLLSPTGERVSANVRVDQDRYVVTSKPAHSATFNEGLWEMHVMATDGTGLQRNVKTAFATAYPTARFDGSVEQAEMSYRLGVEVASAGRYEASAVLFGTTKEGLVPVATSATATWLERGANAITLNFDSEALKASGAAEPFVLRSASLKDQSRMGILERRSLSD